MKKSSAIVAAVVSGALALATAAPASAAKGHTTTQSGATLVATPGTVVFTDSNAYETFTGCGYQPSTMTTIVVTTPSAVSWFGGTSDAAGCISLSHNGFIELPGVYGVAAWQNNAKTGKSTVVAQTTFSVVTG